MSVQQALSHSIDPEQPLVEDTHTYTALSLEQAIAESELQVVGFDCAGIERLSVPQPNSCLLLGEPICIVFLQRSLRLVVGRHTQLP